MRFASTPTRRNYQPIVTLALLCINVAVWVLLEANGGSTDDATLTRFGMKVNVLISAGEVWRLFTPMFLHIGFLHLALNSYSLYNVGTQLEQFIGPWRFSVIYLFAGVCGNVLSYGLGPYNAAGASGAIFGIIGALGMYFIVNRRAFANVNAILTNILIIIAINLAYGAQASNIDNYGHLGGLLGGLAMGALVMPRAQLVSDERGWQRLAFRASPLRWALAGLLTLALLGGIALLVSVKADAAETHLARGKLLYETQQWRAAADELTVAVTRDESLYEGYFYLGLARFQQRDFRAAALAFEVGLRRRENARMRFNLALCYIELGRVTDARAQLNQYKLTRGADRAKADELLKQLESR